ncbi:HEXXH motif-containing putative peptide modification protein [Streptomyces sp. NPDC057027]|uniref:aKG-HExxH-type peptide beta-hydroxylase n=1 Tax=Streptomyces sp. NPDC057027 TaxID=3346004 RepID=UPI00362541EB
MSDPANVAALASQGGFSVGVVAPGAHVTYFGASPAWPADLDHIDQLSDMARVGARLPETHLPLALPQRRVARERLRGREGLVSTLTESAARRMRGDPDVPGVWLLRGMGGCGKTSIALETAHRLTDVSTRVWWVSGAEAEGLSSALRAVAFAAGARPADFVGAHPADVLWKHLDALTTPWLLVLDNVDDPAVLAAAPSRTADGLGWLRLPARTCGLVLLTSRESRAARWGPWVQSVGVDVLSDEDGADVLLDLAPRAGTPEEARQLAAHLGGLPLALGLAGAYLARTREDPWPSPSTPDTFTAYQRCLDARLAEMTSDPDADLGQAERTRRAILSTYELSLDLLHRQGADLARPLLRLLSAFGAAPIPYLELLKPELLVESELFPAPTGERLREALEGLAGLSLITIERTPEAEVPSGGGPLRWITMHPMVRAANRGHADSTTLAPRILRLVTALLQQVTRPLMAENPRHWPMCRAFAPHSSAALSLLTACEPGIGDDRETVTAATEPAVRSAHYLICIGLYGDACAELDAICRLRARLLGDEAPAVIAARLDLARAMRHNGELAASEELYRVVARVAERALPYGHPYLQSARTGRARALRELGRYEAAEMELRVALAMRRRDPQAPLRSILGIRHELARVAHRQGRFDEAVAELRELRRLTGPGAQEGDIGALAVGFSLAWALRDAGQAEEAENVAEEAVREHEAFLASDHPYTLAARHERARILRDHESDPKLLEKARDEFTDIWRANERQFGPDHPDTVSARHELATVWHLLGDLERAEEHFAAALEAGRPRLGAHHPSVVICAHNLAMVRAERAGRDAPSESAAGPVHPHDAERSQGALFMDNPSRTGGVALPSVATGSEIPSLQEALAGEGRPGGSTPAEERLLTRFIQPFRTAGETAGDGGVSWGYDGTVSLPAFRNRVTGPRQRTLRRRTYRPVRDSSPLFDPQSPTFTFDVATLQAIATGRHWRALGERIRVQQYGIRLLALRELLRLAAEESAGHEGGLPNVDEVRSLLLRADEEDPDAVAEVLLHPTVGRWLSQALGALRTGIDASLPLSARHTADLPHLHGVAAAAAIRAGIAFSLRVPLSSGFAHLPTLGAADLAASGETVAEVRVTNDSVSVSSGHIRVRVITRGDEASPGWIPAHHIRSPLDSGDFDLLLEDLDPYREPDGPVQPSRLAGREVGYWRHVIDDAGGLLGRIGCVPGAALSMALTSLTPLPTAPEGTTLAVSSSDAFGGIALSVPEDSSELAETLVHEFGHMKLHAVMDSADLYEQEDENGAAAGRLYYAPWRQDPRPLPGLLHGVFVHMGVVDFWRRLASKSWGVAQWRAHFRLVHWQAQTRDTFTVLRSYPGLTETGRFFVDMMGDTIATWTDDEGIPDGVAVPAMEAAVAHRVRWRLRHLRPEAGAVEELADAWAAGVPCPARRPAVDIVVPGFHAAGADDYTALLCKVATERMYVRGSAVTSGAVRPVDGLDPSDLARLNGDVTAARLLAGDQVTRQAAHHEPWVRLALAWRSSDGPTLTEAPGAVRTARSLTGCPEVVRAVHARVTERTGTMLDPAALADWLAVPDGTVGLPALPPMYPL